MKLAPSESSAAPVAPLKRRGVLLGTGAAALAGVAVAVASRAGTAQVPEVQTQARKDDAADGYRLSEHVKRYYETTRV